MSPDYGLKIYGLFCDDYRPFYSLPYGGKIHAMQTSDQLTPALKKAQQEGIDLSQLYECLSLTPTERIRKNLQMLALAEECRKAGEKKRGRPPS